MSPDRSEKPQPIPYGDLGNPQSLNVYAYVLNTPLDRRDPDGHCYPLCTVLGGAALGALAGSGAELIHEAFNGQKLDRSKIEHAAIGGAIAGAISGLAGPEAGLAAKAAISIGGSVVGGGTERALNGETVGTPGAIAIDAVAGALGAGAEKGIAAAIPDVAAGSVVTDGAGRSFTAEFRTEAGSAAENIARNAVRTAADGAAQTATGVANSATQDALQSAQRPAPPPAPKPPKERNQ